MFDKNTLSFFKELASHNEREWFLQHKPEYQKIVKKAAANVQVWIDGLATVDAYVKDNEADKAIFRIYKDVRFSADKTPYKTHIGMAISRGGRKGRWAGWYLHIEPHDKSFFAAGSWGPEKDELKAIRQEIDYNATEFLSIVHNKDFVNAFNDLNVEYKLKRVPKGYEEDNPIIEYLKLKSFTITKSYKDTEVLHQDFMHQVIADSKTSLPFIHFLNRALEDVLL